MNWGKILDFAVNEKIYRQIVKTTRCNFEMYNNYADKNFPGAGADEGVQPICVGDQ